MLTQPDAIDKLRQLVIDRLRSENRQALKYPAKHKAYLESTSHMVARSHRLAVNNEDIRAVVDDLLGYGPVNSILTSSDRVTEVQVTAYNKIYAEENGILLPTGISFRDEKSLRTLGEKITLMSGRRLDESTPFVNTKLPDGTRVNITIPPIAGNGTTISFRRFPRPYTMQELVSFGTLTEEAYAYKYEVIKNGSNFALTGAMSSGKTTIP